MDKAVRRSRARGEGNRRASCQPLQRRQQPGSIDPPISQRLCDSALFHLQRGYRLLRRGKSGFEREDGSGHRHELLLEGA